MEYQRLSAFLLRGECKVSLHSVEAVSVWAAEICFSSLCNLFPHWILRAIFIIWVLCKMWSVGPFIDTNIGTLMEDLQMTVFRSSGTLDFHILLTNFFFPCEPTSKKQIPCMCRVPMVINDNGRRGEKVQILWSHSCLVLKNKERKRKERKLDIIYMILFYLG